MSALVVPIGAIDVGEIARIVLLLVVSGLLSVLLLVCVRFLIFKLCRIPKEGFHLSVDGEKRQKRSDFSGRIYVLRFCSFPLPLASCLFTTIFARQTTTQRRTILSESGVLTGATGTDVSTKKTSRILNWFCRKTRPFVYPAFLVG